MLPVYLLFVFAYASAAPFGGAFDLFGRPPHDEVYFRPSDYEVDSLFDTEKYFSHVSQDVSNLERILEEFYNVFPSSINREGIEGNEYVIQITLRGYKEDDIIVKAREGLVMIQAVRTFHGVIAKQYLDIRTLPGGVNPSGSWTYSNDLLKLTFPLIKTTDVEETTTNTEAYLTEIEENNKSNTSEEVTDDNVDIKVEGFKPAVDERNEVETSRPDTEIEAVSEDAPSKIYETTTYAVHIDPKSEVEFVPIHY